MARLISDAALATVVIWQEARGEPYEAKLGVAEVIRNRLERRWQGARNLPEVVFARYQFSAMNDDTPWRGASFAIDDMDGVVTSCMKAWQEAEAGSDITQQAVQFLNVDLAIKLGGGKLPSWYDMRKITVKLGALTFLRA